MVILGQADFHELCLSLVDFFLEYFQFCSNGAFYRRVNLTYFQARLSLPDRCSSASLQSCCVKGGIPGLLRGASWLVGPSFGPGYSHSAGLDDLWSVRERCRSQEPRPVMLTSIIILETHSWKC